jgi:C4-dicarboxylate-specific signal transduction histidine kinase
MRRRIVICLALLLALCLIGDAIALVCLNTSIGQVTALAESHRIQMLRAELAASGVRLERDLLAHFANPGDVREEYEADVRVFDRSLTDCNSCHHEPVIEADLKALRRAFDSYRERISRIWEAGAAERVALDEETRRMARDVVKRCATMSEMASAHLVVKSEDAARSVRQAWIALLGTMAAALIVGGFVAFHLKRRITAPLETLMVGIEHVRRGELGYRMNIDGDEEFRALASALNQANEGLQAAQDGLVQAEKMAAIGKMAAGIAHEVGNPLASISSVAQMMKREGISATQAERVDLIMQHIARVSRTVRELLTFSRPADENRHGKVNVGSLLDHTISLLRFDKRAGTTRIECHTHGNLDMARGDADALLLTFTNVILNAFDALNSHSDGEAVLEITGVREGDRIIVRIKDNGPGMSETQINNAFEPFFTTKEPGKGTGLGLWISYQVVRKHHGKIHIESSPGAGAAITIELPSSPKGLESNTNTFAPEFR